MNTAMRTRRDQKKFQPLLAAVCEDLDKLKFPVWASPKLDGIRCVKIDGRALTRTLKPVPNHSVRRWIERNLPSGVDGELMLRDPKATFEEVTSAIMSRDGHPDFVYCLFDYLYAPCAEFVGFECRLRQLRYQFRDERRPQVRVLPQRFIRTKLGLLAYHATNMRAGFEGTMIRSRDGVYKFGRSTAKQGILLKLKAFVDDDARVVGMIEKTKNVNELTRDERGYAKRSTAKAGKVRVGVLGALRCQMPDGTAFEIGSGFTDEQRKRYWQAGNNPVGMMVKFKHQPPPGGRQRGQKPRFPVFIAFRED